MPAKPGRATCRTASTSRASPRTRPRAHERPRSRPPRRSVVDFRAVPETNTRLARRPLARPERTRFALSDDAAGAARLQRPPPGAGAAASGVLGPRMLLIFAGAPRFPTSTPHLL